MILIVDLVVFNVNIQTVLLLLLLLLLLSTTKTVIYMSSDRVCRSQAASYVLDQADRHGGDGWLSIKRKDLAPCLSRHIVVG